MAALFQIFCSKSVRLQSTVNRQWVTHPDPTLVSTLSWLLLRLVFIKFTFKIQKTLNIVVICFRFMECSCLLPAELWRWQQSAWGWNISSRCVSLLQNYLGFDELHHIDETKLNSIFILNQNMTHWMFRLWTSWQEITWSLSSWQWIRCTTSQLSKGSLQMKSFFWNREFRVFCFLVFLRWLLSNRH